MVCRAISSWALVVSASASSGKPVASAFAQRRIRVSIRGSSAAGGRCRWSAAAPGVGPTGSMAGSRSSTR
ncbi:hypothetical protein SBADM41S_10329 [Streptomyces badius]